MDLYAPLICTLIAFGLAVPAAADQPLSPERERALKSADSFRECDRCPEMVVVPTGSYTMGSPESEKGRNSWEGPTRVVNFNRPFAVGKFEVTVDQFAAFIRDAAYKAGATCWTFEGGSFDGRSGRGWHDPGHPQAGSHAAACLSWRDAKAYTEWLGRKTGSKGYRLLTEAEWEYAARARTTPGPAPRFSFGDDENAICAHGNALDQTAKGTLPGAAGKWEFVGCSDGHAYTSPVGGFAANRFGLHDMHGNVKEWIEDCFHEGQGYRGAPADGSAWAAGDCRIRVQRGGSWLSYARLLRAAMRFRGGADDRASDIGVRVARTLSVP
jgi:formylglycine-generating enzyme required for sulfatase activity